MVDPDDVPEDELFIRCGFMVRLVLVPGPLLRVTDRFLRLGVAECRRASLVYLSLAVRIGSTDVYNA